MSKLKVVSIVISMFLVMGANAQKATGTSEVKIQTNGTCQACKNKIEQGLAYEKGVKDVEYDLATAVVKVTYHADKTSVEALRAAINKLGFSADGQKPEGAKKTDCQHKSGDSHDHSGCKGHQHGEGHSDHSGCKGHQH
jgi:copper chaperone CopZ